MSKYEVKQEYKELEGDPQIKARIRGLQYERHGKRMLADVPTMVNTPEIRMDCPEDRKFPVVTGLVEEFKKEYDVIDVDGARVLFDGGWGLVRASNTQPVLVLRFEATDEKRLEEIRKLFMGKVEKYLK